LDSLPIWLSHVAVRPNWFARNFRWLTYEEQESRGKRG
jgi:hypothetical protein